MAGELAFSENLVIATTAFTVVVVNIGIIDAVGNLNSIGVSNCNLKVEVASWM